MVGKIIVSLLVIYIYIFLKTRENINRKEKQKWLSCDLLFLLLPILLLIENDLIKMAIYIVLSMICCLIYIHKHKGSTYDDKMKWKLKTGIILLIYLIPTIFYFIFLNQKYLLVLYGIISLLCYFNETIILFLNKIEIKIRSRKE
jgi:hypothetical protein